VHNAVKPVQSGIDNFRDVYLSQGNAQFSWKKLIITRTLNSLVTALRSWSRRNQRLAGNGLRYPGHRTPCDTASDASDGVTAAACKGHCIAEASKSVDPGRLRLLSTEPDRVKSFGLIASGGFARHS